MDRLPEDVLVERPREVAVQEFVVVDGLGNHPANETEVVQMVWVHVGAGIGTVGDSVSRGGGEKSVVWVEQVSGDDDVEFSQKPSGILSFFSLKLDVKVPLKIFGGAAVELAEGIFKDMFATKMNDDIFATQAPIVKELQFVSEVASFDVKVEDLCVVDEDGKRTF